MKWQGFIKDYLSFSRKERIAVIVLLILIFLIWLFPYFNKPSTSFSSLLSDSSLIKDIQIIYTGLRPGEKLHEELLNNAENTLPTHHPQILIGKVREYDLKEVEEKVNHIIELFPSQDNFEIVACIKDLVPEYVSNNSEFEKLDNPAKNV